MQIIIIRHIGRDSDVDRCSYRRAALRGFAKRRRGRVIMPKTADVLEDNGTCCAGGIGLDI
nr:hypothetical protein HKBLJLKJ_00175 [Porcine reproductive and respiratory syndrome virus]